MVWGSDLKFHLTPFDGNKTHFFITKELPCRIISSDCLLLIAFDYLGTFVFCILLFILSLRDTIDILFARYCSYLIKVTFSVECLRLKHSTQNITLIRYE